MGKCSKNCSLGCCCLYSFLVILVAGCATVIGLFYDPAIRGIGAQVVPQICVVDRIHTPTDTNACLKHGWRISNYSTPCVNLEGRCVAPEDAGAVASDNVTVHTTVLVDHFMDIFEEECLPCEKQRLSMTADRLNHLHTSKLRFTAYMDMNKPGFSFFRLSDTTNFTRLYMELWQGVLVFAVPSLIILLALVIPTCCCLYYKCKDSRSERRWQYKSKQAHTDIEYRPTSLKGQPNVYQDPKESLLYRGTPDDGYRTGLLSAGSGSGSTPPRVGSGPISQGGSQTGDAVPMNDLSGSEDQSRSNSIMGPAPLATVVPANGLPSAGRDSPDGSVLESTPMSQYDRFKMMRNQAAYGMSLPRSNSQVSGAGPQSPITPSAYRQMQFPPKRNGTNGVSPAGYTHSLPRGEPAVPNRPGGRRLINNPNTPMIARVE